MKEVALIARTAYVQALKNKVTLNGKLVPVYAKMIPSDVAYPYIYIPTQRSQNNSAKNYFSTDHTINVEAVVRSASGNNSNELDLLSGQVKEILAKMHHIDMPQLTGGLWNVDTTFEDDNELTDYDSAGVVFRRIMTFSNIIDEV